MQREVIPLSDRIGDGPCVQVLQDGSVGFRYLRWYLRDYKGTFAAA